MRKKIFAYIGSNSSHSNTADYLQKVIECIRECEDIEFELYTTRSQPIQMCKGCNNCFFSHKCSLDADDNFGEIKAKMIAADFIILGSPIYLHNVSGGMKNFIDRTTYWSHIFPLRGKNSMVLSSADSNGGNIVNNYLEKVLNYFGSPVVTKACIMALDGYDDGKIREHAGIIANCLAAPVAANEKIEAIFNAMKQVMVYRYENGKDVESMYWHDNGFFEAETFDQLVNKTKCLTAI